MAPAAADEVSASIAHLFSAHAQDYQALATKAAAFHDQFAHTLAMGAFSYASVEATLASLLQDLSVNAGHVLISLATIAADPFLFIASTIAFGPLVAFVFVGYATSELYDFLTTGTFYFAAV